MPASIADVVVISQFHNEYNNAFDAKVSNFATIAAMEAQFDSKGAPRATTRRVGTIAVSEAALELAQEGIEYAATPERIMHAGVEFLTRVLVAETVGIHLVAEGQDGQRSIIKFRQKTEVDDERLTEMSGTDLISGILSAVDDEVANRADFYKELASLQGGDELHAAEHHIAIRPETEVAIAAGKLIFNNGSSTDYVNNGIQAFAALDRMQRSGVTLRFYDQLGNSSDLPLLRPQAVGPGELSSQQYDALAIAQTFISKVKTSRVIEQANNDEEFDRIIAAEGFTARPRQFKKLLADPGSPEITGYGYDTPEDVVRAILEDIFVGSTIYGDGETAGIAYALHGLLMKDDGRPLRQGYRLLQALSYARRAEVQYGNTLDGEDRKAAYERAINCTIEINSHLHELKTTWPEMQKYLDRDCLLPSVWSEQLQWEKDRKIRWIAWGPSVVA